MLVSVISMSKLIFMIKQSPNKQNLNISEQASLVCAFSQWSFSFWNQCGSSIKDLWRGLWSIRVMLRSVYLSVAAVSEENMNLHSRDMLHIITQLHYQTQPSDSWLITLSGHRQHPHNSRTHSACFSSSIDLTALHFRLVFWCIANIC